MASNIHGFPFARIEFKKNGAIHIPDEVRAVAEMCKTLELSDLLVVSHGWNNNVTEATELYEALAGSMRTLLDSGVAPKIPRHKTGFLGVFWPSKKFTPEELQPGGGASLAGAEHLDALLVQEIGALGEFSSHPEASTLVREALDALQRVEERADAERFRSSILKLLDEPGGQLTEELPSEMTELRASDLFDRLSGIILIDDLTPVAGGGAGGVTSIRVGVQRFLNLLTYFKMKKRAGVVGERGMVELLHSVKREAPSTRLHLVGHSFGGRLVAAAASALGSRNVSIVETVTLLQAAFSHNGFAQNYRDNHDGYFRPAITKHGVRRRIAVTHTHNDKANKLAYPLATRLHRVDGAALGDEDDRFGAIGANGALHTPEAVSLSMPLAHHRHGAPPDKLVLNFNADDCIRDHGDVSNQHVANLVLLTVEDGIL